MKKIILYSLVFMALGCATPTEKSTLSQRKPAASCANFCGERYMTKEELDACQAGVDTVYYSATTAGLDGRLESKCQTQNLFRLKDICTGAGWSYAISCK